jgi:RHS repeat-associated protein
MLARNRWFFLLGALGATVVAIFYPVEQELELQHPVGMRYFYDALNRVVKTQFNDNGQVRENSTEYNGLTIKVTNAKDQSKSDTKDVAGRIEKSVDANGKITLYSHDPYNNLTKTTDPLGNVVQIEYDDLGRRIKLVDPDLGINTYVVNPIGQVIEQVSPKQRKSGQKTTMKYDELGRMFARDEPDLKGHWVYDQQLTQSCRTNKTCGKLIESYVLNGNTKDNQQTHSFDSFGRPSSTTLQRDVAYTQTISYDTWGRPLIETQQRASEAVKTFERRYNGYGFQYQTLRKTSSGYQVLWQADQLDASQRLTTARLGNLLKIERSYEADTGRLSSASLKTYTNTQQLGESYTYDALGNVANRHQNWGSDIANQPVNSFDEIFTYDPLNRLKTASVTGFPTQTFDYNDIGNLISKTGVGSYTYPSTVNNSVSNYDSNGMSTSRPHAVVSTTLHSNFSYDENGNLVSGSGRSLTWTSFDMPATINKASESSSFVYGADHQRTRQSKTDGAGNITDVYYAGAMEVEKARSTGAIISIKTYWPGGLGVEIDKPNQNAELRWTHTDRLGSVIAITNEGGALVERLAYDSWGKRRSLSGNETLDSIDGITDNKGFTGHEMLDKLDLVHMNGRIYDPLVARFMSADPIIQDPMHSQSYNRYTYVWNNPTNLTDPTGFVAAQVTVSITATAAQNGVCPEGEMCATGTNTKTGKEELYVITVNSVTITNEQGVSRSFEWTGGKSGHLVETKVSAITSLVEKGDNWLHKTITGKSANNETPSFGESVVKLLDPIRGATEASRSSQEGDHVGAGLIAVSIVVKPARYLDGVLGSLGTRLKSFLGMNPCKCFVAGTVIHTKRGLVPIEKIQVGDWVAARSDETSETAYKQVVRLVRNGEKEIIRLRYRLPNGKFEVLGVTEEHPFMLEGRRWINAGALKPGDKIMRLAGGVLTVVSMHHQVIKQHTFNFEVDGFHTYFAGVGGAWVHNSGGPCGLILKNGAESSKAAADLAKHLGYVQKYGKGGVKELEDGTIRYYGELKAPDKAGEMAGARYVHEFDPLSGKSRGWMETLDHNGTVRQVRPEFNNGIKTHYKFDSGGNFTGSW